MLHLMKQGYDFPTVPTDTRACTTLTSKRSFPKNELGVKSYVTQTHTLERTDSAATRALWHDVLTKVCSEANNQQRGTVSDTSLVCVIERGDQASLCATNSPFLMCIKHRAFDRTTTCDVTPNFLRVMSPLSAKRSTVSSHLWYTVLH